MSARCQQTLADGCRFFEKQIPQACCQFPKQKAEQNVHEWERQPTKQVIDGIPNTLENAAAVDLFRQAGESLETGAEEQGKSGEEEPEVFFDGRHVRSIEKESESKLGIIATT